MSFNDSSALVNRSDYLLFYFQGSAIFCHVSEHSKVHKLDNDEFKILRLCSKWLQVGIVLDRLNLPTKRGFQKISKLLKLGMLHMKTASTRIPSQWKPIEFAFHRNSLDYADEKNLSLISRAGCSSQAYKLLKPSPLDSTLTESLLSRRSIRKYNNSGRIPFNVLSTVIGYTLKKQGSFTRQECISSGASIVEDGYDITGRPKYSYPVGGAENSLKIFFYSSRVQSLPMGLYAYDSNRNSLRLVRKCKTEHFCNYVFQNTEWIKKASGVFIICFNIRKRKHYKNNFKLGLIEAGHLSQNILLVSNACGVKCCEYGNIHEKNFFMLADITPYTLVPLSSIAIGRNEEQ